MKNMLGNTGLEVPPLIFGGNVFGWTADEGTSFALLDEMVEAGFNAIDTADAYTHWAPGNQGGESETIIGNWLHRRGRRDRVVIFTKVGLLPNPDGAPLSRSNVIRAADNSLRRLRTDFIDLYQVHRDDPTTPLTETLEAFSRLVKAGKVRAIGASNYSAGRLGRSAGDQPAARRAGICDLADPLQSDRARRVRTNARTAVPGGRPGRVHLLFAGRRLPDRQILLRRRHGAECPRPALYRQIPQRALSAQRLPTAVPGSAAEQAAAQQDALA
jgi:hypothetical protein